MWKNSIQFKSTEFKKDKLNLIKGHIPKDFEGRLFRNGPGVLGRNN
jgi:carotenoid cleavage dioxygenase-like enzyme